jgi:hypothetical protein
MANLADTVLDNDVTRAKMRAMMLIGLTGIDSSMISEFIYQVVDNILEITFASTGETYIYYHVPFSVVLGLWKEVDAGRSAGQYFNREIKNQYPFQVK